MSDARFTAVRAGKVTAVEKLLASKATDVDATLKGETPRATAVRPRVRIEFPIAKTKAKRTR